MLVLPILVPLSTAVVLMLVPARPTLRRWLGFGGSVCQLLSAVALFAQVQSTGYVVAQMGNWAAPFGITLVADVLASMMLSPSNGSGQAP